MPKLPHSLELERCVLGAGLMFGLNVEEVAALPTEVFYSGQHQLVHAAMVAMHEEGRDIEVVTVMDRLEQTGRLEQAGGYELLTRCQELAAGAIRFDEHVARLRDMHARRTLIESMEAAIAKAYESEDPAEAVAIVSNAIEVAGGQGREDDGDLIQVCAPESLAYFEGVRAQRRLGGYAGIQSDLEYFKQQQPLLAATITMLAARQGTGKTSLACWLAVYAADKGHPVYMSAMDTNRHLVNLWMASMIAEVDPSDANRGYGDDRYWDQIRAGFDTLSGLPIKICKRSGQTATDIIAKARRYFKGADRLPLLIVDHIQKVKPPPGVKSLYESRTATSGILTGGVHDLECAGLVLSQLKREGRAGGNRPSAEDLRDSGAIEEDADQIIFLHRNGDSEQIEVYSGKNRASVTPKSAYFKRCLTRHRHIELDENFQFADVRRKDDDDDLL